MTTKSFRYLSGNGQVELHEAWTEELPCLGLTKPFYLVETYVLQFFSEILSFNQNVDSAKGQLISKQNCRALTSSKKQTKDLFFYPEGLEILET